MFAKRTNWDLASNRLGEALEAHRARGKPLVDVTVSNPTECGFEYDSSAILKALSNPDALSYEPNPRGLESARRAVAGYYADRKEDVSAEDIFLTTSTSEAYSYVFRTLCNPGDELLIPSPSYPLFDFLAEIQDVSGPRQGKREALARLEVIADTYLSVNAPLQLAIPQFLGQRHAFHKQVIARVQRNLAELDRQLAEQGACSRLAVEGGWCAVLRVPATRSDEDLAIELVTTQGVSVHPGHFYDFASDGYLVVSLITPERTFAAGTGRLLSFF